METSIVKKFIGFTSNNRNIIAKTLIGLVWIRNGKIIRPATTYEWEYAHSWGRTHVYGNITVILKRRVFAMYTNKKGDSCRAMVTAMSVDTIRGCDPEKFGFTKRIDGRRFAFYYTHYDKLMVTEPTPKQWEAIHWAVVNIDAISHSPTMTGQGVGALTSRCVTVKQARAMGMSDMIEE